MTVSAIFSRAAKKDEKKRINWLIGSHLERKFGFSC
jgi:hypothetical protein